MRFMNAKQAIVMTTNQTWSSNRATTLSLGEFAWGSAEDESTEDDIF
jgi:hypothetical protein